MFMIYVWYPAPDAQPVLHATCNTLMLAQYALKKARAQFPTCKVWVEDDMREVVFGCNDIA